MTLASLWNHTQKLVQLGQRAKGRWRASPGARGTAPMVVPYAMLLTCAVAFGVVFFVFLEVGWIRALFSSLAAGVVASLLTVFLIDRSLERRREEERGKVREVALGQMHEPLARQILLFSKWYKAAVAEPPEPPPASVNELFGDDFCEQVRWMDFSSPAPIEPPVNWLHYSAQQMGQSRQELERVADRYVLFLDPPVVELLERVANSSLVSMFLGLAWVDNARSSITRPVPPLSTILWDASCVQPVRDHLQSLQELLGHFDAESVDVVCREALVLWRTDVGPAVGSARARMTDA